MLLPYGVLVVVVVVCVVVFVGLGLKASVADLACMVADIRSPSAVARRPEGLRLWILRFRT